MAFFIPTISRSNCSSMSNMQKYERVLSKSVTLESYLPAKTGVAENPLQSSDVVFDCLTITYRTYCTGISAFRPAPAAGPPPQASTSVCEAQRAPRGLPSSPHGWLAPGRRPGWHPSPWHTCLQEQQQQVVNCWVTVDSKKQRQWWRENTVRCQWFSLMCSHVYKPRIINYTRQYTVHQSGLNTIYKP